MKGYSDFTGDDSAALAYIAARGYASYSSIKNVRDKAEPSKMPTAYFTFGAELHSKFLEGIRDKVMSDPEEEQLEAMIDALNGNKFVRSIMATKGMKTEVEICQPINGLPFLAYIDIDAPTFIADLKSTQFKDRTQFIRSMDFLQAAIYMRLRPKATDFYYLGISKVRPYKVMPFGVTEYPTRLRDANLELNNLIRYVKSKIGDKLAPKKKGR